MRQEYWAAREIQEVAAEVKERFENYRQWLAATRYADRVRTAYNRFYGFDNMGTLEVVRDDKDLARINVNQYKSLIKRLHIMATEQKLAYQPRAKTSDTKSEIESSLAKGIVEYYSDERQMGSTLSNGVLGALVMLEQFIHAPWDTAAGYELTADEGQTIKSGDQIFETYSAFDVARATAADTTPWYIIRKRERKHDLAALHPQFTDEILAETMEADKDGLHVASGMQGRPGAAASNDQEDFCYTYTFYHARTPAMPEGRRSLVCAGQVLSDGPLVYDKPPVFRLSAGDILQTCFGDSPAVDLLPLQQALDALSAATLTNNLNNALQLIWSQDANLSTRRLADGQILVSSAAKPEALNLTGSAAENYKLLDSLKQDMQLLSGVNDVARGNPSSNLKSGSSLALVLAQAIQFVSDLQKSYARTAGDVASCLVANIQKFATEEMTAYIVGASKKGMIKKFKADDMMNVERVAVDLGNPLTQTLAGRSELMQQWMQYGAVKDLKQIVTFLETGNLDQAIEDDFSDALLISEEAEMIKRGEKPLAVLLDNHAEHILEHKKIASTPEARANPELMAVLLDHIDEHIQWMRQVPPDLAAVISGQPLPPPGPPPGPEGAPPQPTVNGARMPSIPEEAPAESQENYQQTLDSIPPQEG